MGIISYLRCKYEDIMEQISINKIRKQIDESVDDYHIDIKHCMEERDE